MKKNSEYVKWFRTQLLSAGITILLFSVILFIGFIILFPGERGWNEFISFVIGLLGGVLLSTKRMPDPLKIAPLFNRQGIQFNKEKPYELLSEVWKDIPKHLYVVTTLLYLLVFLLITIFSAKDDQLSHFSLISLFGGIIVSASLCPSVFFLYSYNSFPDSESELSH